MSKLSPAMQALLDDVKATQARGAARYFAPLYVGARRFGERHDMHSAYALRKRGLIIGSKALGWYSVEMINADWGDAIVEDAHRSGSNVRPQNYCCLLCEARMRQLTEQGEGHYGHRHHMTDADMLECDWNAAIATMPTLTTVRQLAHELSADVVGLRAFADDLLDGLDDLDGVPTDVENTIREAWFQGISTLGADDDECPVCGYASGHADDCRTQEKEYGYYDGMHV